MKPLVLKCHACGDPLQSTEQSVLFLCSACRRWYEADDETLRQVTLRRLTPTGRRSADFHLPFRVFTVTTTVEGDDRDRVAAARRRAADFTTVYVHAFHCRSVVDRVDWGLELTEAHWPFGGVDVSDVPDLGICSRSTRDCVPFVRAYLTLLIDPVADVTDLVIECTTSSPRLVAVPFHRSGTLVADLLLGRSHPAACIHEAHVFRPDDSDGKVGR